MNGERATAATSDERTIADGGLRVHRACIGCQPAANNFLATSGDKGEGLVMREDGAVAADEVVELVDETGRHAGTMPMLTAHDFPGQLHGAFSVFLFDERNRMLLQRRTMAKHHSRGMWANSCQGHQRPGEPPVRGAIRRTTEELGIVPYNLRWIGKVVYRFRDAMSGLVEYELSHICVGRALSEPWPDPAEITETKWVRPDELRKMLVREDFVMWFRTVTEIALSRRAATVTRISGWDPDDILGALDIPD